MNLLLHICCACCLCAPLNELRKEGFRVTGLFYNPNIHPFLEFRRRLKALRVFQESDPIPVIYHEEYGIREYLKNVNYEGVTAALIVMLCDLNLLQIMQSEVGLMPLRPRCCLASTRITNN